jgi:hypothetical protein
MHQLLKQNVLIENKIRSECRNYLNKMRLQRISSRANASILKQNVLTENKIRSECRNYLNKMCLPRISSRANASIT